MATRRHKGLRAMPVVDPLPVKAASISLSAGQRGGASDRPVLEPMTMWDLAARLGIAMRTIRTYTARGVFVPPPFRGGATRYGLEHLLQLRAIQSMRDAGMRLPEIRARLEAERAAKDAAQTETASNAGGRARAGVEGERATGGVASGGDAAAAAAGGERVTAVTARALPGGLPREAWSRVPLAPGLELFVRDDAGPLVERLAREIHARYGIRAPGAHAAGEIAEQA